MIDGLRKRIVDLEREASQEEGRGVAQEERAAKKEMLTKMVSFLVVVLGLLQLLGYTQSYIFLCHNVFCQRIIVTHPLPSFSPSPPPPPPQSSPPSSHLSYTIPDWRRYGDGCSARGEEWYGAQHRRCQGNTTPPLAIWVSTSLYLIPFYTAKVTPLQVTIIYVPPLTLFLARQQGDPLPPYHNFTCTPSYLIYPLLPYPLHPLHANLSSLPRLCWQRRVRICTQFTRPRWWNHSLIVDLFNACQCADWLIDWFIVNGLTILNLQYEINQPQLVTLDLSLIQPTKPYCLLSCSPSLRLSRLRKTGNRSLPISPSRRRKYTMR